MNAVVRTLPATGDGSLSAQLLGAVRVEFEAELIEATDESGHHIG